MNALRHVCGSLCLIVAGLSGVAEAGPLDVIYDDDDLISLGQSYERGWQDNYENVIEPHLTDAERSRLNDMRFQMELRVADSEPFAFMAGGNIVLVSAASIRFLEDVVMAYTWLDEQGLSTQSVADYLLMLRYWDAQDGKPPKPWDVLCVPPNAFDLEPYGDKARRVFNSAVVFAMLHEVGHIYHRHPGNRAVEPEISRNNESAADRFALEMFARIGDVPLGVTMLFFTMAYLHENQADFDNVDLYKRSLAARTHPLSPKRIENLALFLSNNAATFGQGFGGGAAAALAVAIEVSQFSLLLGDRDIQQLSSWIGRSVAPQDLGPRLRGRHLGLPCGEAVSAGEPFDGLLHGEITAGTSSLEIDAILRRDGDGVTGTYSVGAGFGRLEGTISGDTLTYNWDLLGDAGTAILSRDNDGAYRGTWRPANADTDAGTILLLGE